MIEENNRGNWFRENYAAIGWSFVAGSVIAIDIAAPPEQTLSEAVDRAIDRHPIATIAAVGAVALHLLNVFEHYHIEKLDVIHQAASLIRKER